MIERTNHVLRNVDSNILVHLFFLQAFVNLLCKIWFYLLQCHQCLDYWSDCGKLSLNSISLVMLDFRNVMLALGVMRKLQFRENAMLTQSVLVVCVSA